LDASPKNGVDDKSGHFPLAGLAGGERFHRKPRLRACAASKGRRRFTPGLPEPPRFRPRGRILLATVPESPNQTFPGIRRKS